MEVDTAWLSERLHHLSQEDCLGQYKGFLNILCRRSLSHLSNASFSHSVKANALETLVLFVRCMLSKQFSGWEIMDVFAGGVVGSDSLFSVGSGCYIQVLMASRVQAFTKVIDDILRDDNAPGKSI